MRTRPVLVLIAACLLAGTTQAASKDKPPEGVNLSGTWKLDPFQSDEPVEEIKKADKAEIARRRREIEDRDRNMYDPPWDPLDPASRGRGRNRHDPFPDRREDGVTIEGAGVDEKWGTTRSSSLSNDALVGLDPNPETVTINVKDSGKRVSVSEEKLETECVVGEVQPIADAFGDGTLRCWWRGKAWIVETSRKERFRRTDRFELSGNGKLLKYTSTVGGPKIPTVKIDRVYTLVPQERP